MKLGVVAESLGLPFRQALFAAEKAGVTGVQLDAAGDLSPDRLTETGRRELRHVLRAHSLEVSAFNCPLRRGLDHAENQQARIDHVRKALSLSFDLGARVVVVPGPAVPGDDEPERGRVLREALEALGRHGDRVGATLALESGLSSGEALAKYLGTFDVGALAVNYDPANMLLNGLDPVDNLLPLAGRLAHTHARDARFARASRTGAETAVGAGDVDWIRYVATLSAMEYGGYLAVEREGGTQRAADVAAGVSFLRRLLPAG